MNINEEQKLNNWEDRKQETLLALQDTAEIRRFGGQRAKANTDFDSFRVRPRRLRGVREITSSSLVWIWSSNNSNNNANKFGLRNLVQLNLIKFNSVSVWFNQVLSNFRDFFRDFFLPARIVVGDLVRRLVGHSNQIANARLQHELPGQSADRVQFGSQVMSRFWILIASCRRSSRSTTREDNEWATKLNESVLWGNLEFLHWRLGWRIEFDRKKDRALQNGLQQRTVPKMNPSEPSECHQPMQISHDLENSKERRRKWEAGSDEISNENFSSEGDALKWREGFSSKDAWET